MTCPAAIKRKELLNMSYGQREILTAICGYFYAPLTVQTDNLVACIAVAGDLDGHAR
jgi:hypothetical protein